MEINDKWCDESKNQDFDLHAGFMKSAVQVDSDCVGTEAGTCRSSVTKETAGTCSDVVHEPLISNSSTSGSDRVNTACENGKQSSMLPSDASLANLKACASDANLIIHDVPGDGNCMYWAILYQLEANGACNTSISELREMTADYLERHCDFYSQFVSESVVCDNPRMLILKPLMMKMLR